MLIKNPYRHYPIYTAKIFRVDGKPCGQSGMADVEMLYIPGEAEDIIAVVITMRDAGNHPVVERMYVDGEWREYSEKALEELIAKPQKPQEGVQEPQEELPEVEEAQEEPKSQESQEKPQEPEKKSRKKPTWSKDKKFE